MTAHDADRPRFGQLTYTSFDRPGAASGGGWQVKESTGALTPDEEERLREGVVTRFESVRPIPRFPNTEEVRSRPRRLMYAPGTDNTGFYWHTVPAGADASGRPGNVFAHAILDRRTDAVDSTRPIERWGAREWLAPYGADDVAAATLSFFDPKPGGLTSRESTLEFLLDPNMWRIGVFSVLLDAVARAFDGGSPVVLGCADSERAARWIAAVSHFMSPGTSRRFGWSTFDRLHTADDAIASGARLVAVPLEDLPGDTPGCIVFGENESPDLGELDGEPHCVANGDMVPVTPWSLLAQTVLVDESVAARTLAHQDEIARKVGDSELSPMWPLAMAVVAESDLHDSLDEATTVLLEHSPDTVAESEFASYIVDVVDRHLGETADQAARALGRWHADDSLAPVVRSLAGRVFAFRVFDDHAWFANADPAQRVLLEYCDRIPELLREADRLLGEMRIHVSSAHRIEDAAREVLRTLDALIRADLVSDRGEELVFEILELVVVPVLCDRIQGPQLVAEVGQVGEPTCIEYLQPAVITHPDFIGRPLGSRLERSVFAWLASSLAGIPTFDDFDADPSLVNTPQSVIIAEGVFALTEQGEGERVRPELATVALWRAFFELDEGAGPIRELDAVAGAQQWTAPQWCRVVETYRRVVAPRFLQDLVVGDPWSSHIDMLARHILHLLNNERAASWQEDPHHDALAGAWALIRLRNSWDRIGERDLDRDLGRCGLPTITDYARHYDADLPDDVLAALAVFIVAAKARSMKIPALPPKHVKALADAVELNAGFVVDSLVDLAQSGAIDEHWLIAYAVLSSPNAPDVARVADALGVLAHFVVGPESARRGLLDEVATEILPKPWNLGPRDLRSVHAAVRAELMEFRDRDVDRAREAYAGFVEWWYDQRLSDAERALPRPRGQI
ncbi:hypothetical protein ACFWCF_12510 [Rhodococcus sp. NPDC060090]|uniref:GAP1-N2 domain-containing protein n=1 Tax=Rhodococcus sp. NPDC060090 TaxID=3347056 RepID=UPI0036594B4A